jgi:hypothetical protein
MKKLNNSGQPDYGSSLGVSVTVYESPMLRDLVEKLAYQRGDTGNANGPMPSGWQGVETSSIEAFVSGCMDILEIGEHVSLSYTTCFSFTCTKLAGGKNTLSWTSSLS